VLSCVISWNEKICDVLFHNYIDPASIYRIQIRARYRYKGSGWIQIQSGSTKFTGYLAGSGAPLIMNCRYLSIYTKQFPLQRHRISQYTYEVRGRQLQGAVELANQLALSVGFRRRKAAVRPVALTAVSLHESSRRRVCTTARPSVTSCLLN